MIRAGLTPNATVTGKTRIRYNTMEIALITRLEDTTAFVAPSLPRAMKRTAQNGNKPAKIVKYDVKSKMFVQVPNSGFVRFRVNNRLKARPVPILIICAAKMMRPLYWTRIFSFSTLFHCRFMNSIVGSDLKTFLVIEVGVAESD